MSMRNSHIGNMGIWEMLAAEIAPSVNDAIERAIRENPSAHLTREEAHYLLLNWLGKETRTPELEED